MGLGADLNRHLKEAWLEWSERLWPFHSYNLVGAPLPVFPPPRPGPLPDPLPRVAITTPCRDAAGYLATYFALIDALDYPGDRLYLFLLEDSSTDDTAALALAGLKARGGYAETRMVPHRPSPGPGLDGQARQAIGVQRQRRSAIAACRNALLRAAMATDADYILCIDVDMAAIPPDTLRRALSFAAPVLVANCRRFHGGAAFDLNSFVYTRPVSDLAARRFESGGLYQPPAGYFRHYPGLTAPDVAQQVHGVGGTFLLLRRDVIAAGVDFPEAPYRMHIETEGLALKAADAGFGAFMATGLAVRHGPN